eukprot:jgi/Botrbrau1/4752/Bobra.0137s0024.1
MPVFSEAEQHALLLSTLAGLSTGIGGAIAIIRRPGPGLLSLLLGLAIGVMATLSMIEMWLHNAYEHGALSITGAVAVGAGLYCLLQPYFPDFESQEDDKRDQEVSTGKSGASLPEGEALVTKEASHVGAAERKDLTQTRSGLAATASGKALREKARIRSLGLPRWPIPQAPLRSRCPHLPRPPP